MAKKSKSKEMRAIDLVRLFLEENGVECRKYSLRHSTWIDFVRVYAPLGIINVHVVGMEICIRMGQLSSGWDITLKGSIADPNNGALKNLLAMIHHYHTDAWVLMRDISDAKGDK